MGRRLTYPSTSIDVNKAHTAATPLVRLYKHKSLTLPSVVGPSSKANSAIRVWVTDQRKLTTTLQEAWNRC